MDNNKQSKTVGGMILIGLLFGLIGGLVGAAFLYPWLVANISFMGDLAVSGVKTSGGEVLERTYHEVSNESDAVVAAVKAVSPAVVSITEKSSAQDVFGRIVESEASGTGFIVTSDGLILTNKHVASSADAEYTVVTAAGDSYTATVSALDPSNDLAIIKIEADNLPVANLGYSDNLEVGQTVIAIGNAQGEYNNTVTTGVISSADRAITAGDPVTGESERLEGMIQTDATINQGNSGGPLIDLAGNVIGINTAMDAGAEQIAFAIPVDVVRNGLDSYLAEGEIKRPYLGVRYISITPEFADLNSLDVDYGALIYSSDRKNLIPVIPSGPADKAGLEELDIITKIGDDKIDKDHSLSTLIQKYKPGDKVEITYLRDGDEKTVKVTLESL